MILDSAFRDWILGAVVAESSAHTDQKIQIEFLDTARFRHLLRFIYRRYFKKIKLEADDLIINQKTFLFLVNSNLIEKKSIPNLRCHYTHDNEEFLVKSGLIDLMRDLKEILVLNKADSDFLQNLGIERSKISVIYGAINRQLFHPANAFKENREVFISGDAKGRKNPYKIIELINACPDMKFVICGRFWGNLIKGSKLRFDNVSLYDFNLELNAALIRQASVFLTLSYQEGGPFPVLEALASGTPVVATPVGWVPELVDSSKGIIVAQDSSIDEIREAIEKCFEIKKSVWSKDLLEGRFSWEELAMKLYEKSTVGNR